MIFALLCAISGSCDSFICGIVLGLNKIKVTRINALVLSLFPLFFSFVSIMIGQYISVFCTNEVKNSVSIITYLILALYTFHEQRKMTVSKWKNAQGWIDSDADKHLSLSELIPLAFVLSVDSLIIALPLSFNSVPVLLCAIMFGVCNYLSLMGGYYLVKHVKFVENSRILSFSWVIFIILALILCW